MGGGTTNLLLATIGTLILTLCVTTNEHEVDGEIEAGNYTYYRLNSDGRILLTLTTLTGDADLYISDATLQPTFNVDNHCLQSVTCGTDSVEISSSLKRPVGIGIYGHPRYQLSTYKLHIVMLQEEEEFSPVFNDYKNVDDSYGSYSAFSAYRKTAKKHEPKQDESILWTLFISLLKILLEVLT